ncbi:hypothetical protein LCGC14_0698690, partial [marine sediment metagenome]
YDTDQQIDDYLEHVLWRYDENRDVPEYDDPCGCAGWRVSRLVHEALLEQFGNFDEVFRQPWNERVKQHPDRVAIKATWQDDWTREEEEEYFGRLDEIWERVDVEMGTWKAHTAPYFETQNRLI